MFFVFLFIICKVGYFIVIYGSVFKINVDFICFKVVDNEELYNKIK